MKPVRRVEAAEVGVLCAGTHSTGNYPSLRAGMGRTSQLDAFMDHLLLSETDDMLVTCGSSYGMISYGRAAHTPMVLSGMLLVGRRVARRVCLPLRMPSTSN